MRRFSLITAAACAALLFGFVAHAQQPAAPPPPPPPPPAYGAPVTIDQAKKAVAGAMAEAKKLPYLYVFAVVDPSGSLVYFEKMDGAVYASTQIAMSKARAAATYKRPTKVYFDLMEAGHSFVGTLDGMIASAGGIPLMVDGKIIGAIGVSGGPSGLFDTAAAQAGVDALK